MDAEVPSTYPIAAEMCVIGISMVNDKAADRMMAMGLAPEHFFSAAHAAIWRGICGMREDGLTLNALILESRMGQRLEDAGGVNYVIQCMEYAPPGDGQHFAAIVIGKARARECIKLGRAVEADPDLPSAEMDRRLEALLSTSKLGLPAWEPLRSGTLGSAQRKGGVSTGLDSLDEMISTNGWPNGQLSVVSAYHKGGKTALMIQSALLAAKAGLSVLYATFADLSADDIESRQMRMLMGRSHLPEGDMFLQERWHQERTNLARYHHDIYSPVQLRCPRDVETFSGWLDRRMENTPYDVVFLDYAQRIPSKDRKAITEYAEANVVCDLLQVDAFKFDIPFIVGSQITEGGKDGRDITKGSRVWEENAGWVLRIKANGEARTIESAFCRFGMSGASDDFGWDKERLMFTERVR